MRLPSRKKDFVLQTMEGSLVEAQAEIARLNSELSMEKKNFEAKLEAEAEKNSNLRKSLKELQEKCVDFGNQCLQRLKQVSTRLEPALRNSVLRLKTCRKPSNTLRAKLMHLTKL
jgi:chromosome segregation ATPase